MQPATTPDNINYMILGYSVGIVLMVSYVVTLVARFARNRAEIRELEELMK